MSYSFFTSQPAVLLMAQLQTGEAGLAADEAKQRLRQYGLNQLAAREISWRIILWRQFNSPFIFLLLIATAVSFGLGEKIDGLMILGFVVINAILGFLQEYHSEQSLKLLKKYLVTRARARRAGQEEIVDAKTLVPGDLVIVEAGDIIPADIRFIACTDAQVNESVLTGEAAPVEKVSSDLPHEAAAYHEAKNIGFSGTTVVSGKAVGLVIATGRQTALGDISRLTLEARQPSSFEKGIGKFSNFILRMIVLVLSLLFFANVLIKGREANIFELLLFSIALAVSVVPEALPVVTTIALSKGAAKLAKNHVVVKRLSAVEDLGSIEVLCTDKTGTITENKLTVHRVQAANAEHCLLLAGLASPFFGEHIREPNNAFDLAVWSKLNPEQKNSFAHYQKIGEVPFDPERRRNSVLVQNARGCQLIVRGAPETIFGLCVGVSAEENNKLQNWVETEGADGRRVIAVAHRVRAGNTCSVADEQGLTFAGLISFIDPLKASSAEAIREAERLGVRVKILTGDSKEVAAAVGRQVGLVKSGHEVVTGQEFERVSDPEAQMKMVEYAHVFARMSPEQKFRIIEVLQRKYEVGFLGEGINDAPALKMANVGLAVKDASDIARAAADIVLLTKSLPVIVDGIRQGREIFANTVKYIKATLISNFGNFFAIATASLIVSYLPMLPVQILLLNLLSDFPMIAIATDTVDKNELRRPRSYNLREVVLIALILGAVSTIFDFIFFAIFSRHGAASLQTNWFIGSVLTELLLIFSIRTHRPFWRARRPALSLIILSFVALLAALVLPFTDTGHTLFKFITPSVLQILLVGVVVIGYFVCTEELKVLYYRVTNRGVERRGKLTISNT